MSHRLREHTSDAGGFTLIELLVVILIIGILAAIAIPSFLNQKGKSYDASAKELARTAQTTAETYGTDHAAEFKGLTTAALKNYETGLTNCPSNNACFKEGKEIETGKGFEVVTTAANTEDEFTITRNASGEVTRTCTSTKNGCSGANTGTW
jgi:type IV pilus assembly protein PilA